MRSEGAAPIAALRQVTLEVIERRTRLYRKCATAVSMIFLGTIFGVLTAPWGVGLIGLTLLAPVIGTYLLLDLHAVRTWQSHVLDAWRAGMDLADLSAALVAYPLLPRGTLEGMLDTLPPKPFMISKGTASDQTEEWIRRVDQAGLDQARWTAAGALALIVVVCGASTAVSKWAALGLFVAGTAAVLMALRKVQTAFSSGRIGQVPCGPQT